MSEDTAVKEKTSSPEIAKEIQLTGSQIEGFMQDWSANKDIIYEEYNSGNFEPTRFFSSESTAELARDFFPAFLAGANDVAKEMGEANKKMIPEGRFLPWIFLGPFSKVGLSRSKAERALDGVSSEKGQNLVKTQPLSEQETINLSKDEIRDVGRVFGRMGMYLNVAGREISDVHPNKGFLKKTRNEWELESKDKLRLLDTILERYYGDK